MSKTWTAKHDLLAIPDINQGQGKVSVGRQEKIFPWCQLVHTNQKEEVLLQERRKNKNHTHIIFPSVSFKGTAYLHKPKC